VMPRYRLVVEYDGSNYVGWQRQTNGVSIQQSLEEAIASYCGETIRAFAAGRTDAGVHALRQTVHVDIARGDPAITVQKAVNFHLKAEPISVLEVANAGADFHARFSATGRKYIYRILNRPAPPSLDALRVWHVPRKLNVRAMNRAAQRLVGNHDFTTYRSKHCQADSPVKTLGRLVVVRCGNDVRITAHARSFLHNQVRSMVGALKMVGEGRWTEEAVAEALEARDRTAAPPTAPPWGLYLADVDYAQADPAIE
jgi:tRNA pseudouridine38-40 synthase